jgi:hypothetical protein
MGTLWRRILNENRFSGSAPPTISALTALTLLYAPTPALSSLGQSPADASHASQRGRDFARERLVR